MVQLFQIRPLGEVITAAGEWMAAHWLLQLRWGVLPCALLLALLSLPNQVWLVKVGVGAAVYWQLLLMAALVHYEQTMCDQSGGAEDAPVPRPTWRELSTYLPWGQSLFVGLASAMITLLSLAGWGAWVLLLPVLYVAPYTLLSHLMADYRESSPTADVFRLLPVVLPSLMAIGVFLFLVLLGVVCSLGFYYLMSTEVLKLFLQGKQLLYLQQHMIAPIALTFWSVVLTLLASWAVMGAAAVCFFLYGHGIEQLDHPALRRKWTTF